MQIKGAIIKREIVLMMKRLVCAVQEDKTKEKKTNLRRSFKVKYLKMLSGLYRPTGSVVKVF